MKVLLKKILLILLVLAVVYLLLPKYKITGNYRVNTITGQVRCLEQSTVSLRKLPDRFAYPHKLPERFKK
jgi:hypothetical protein